ncbi:MAG TPA: hypothetical protein PKK10_07625 [Woeseiaceae bacterium]|nr:hypothetical protein [Woeseiaceae bacterium]
MNILQSGPGAGEHYIAADPWFNMSRSSIEAKLIRATRESNDRKPDWVLTKIRICDLTERLSASGILELLVDHESFKSILEQRLVNKIRIDARGIWTSAKRLL